MSAKNGSTKGVAWIFWATLFALLITPDGMKRTHFVLSIVFIVVACFEISRLARVIRDR